MLMKTAVSIPDEVFRKADRLARQLRVSRSELYTKALDAFVRTMDDREVRDALDRVYATEPSELDPVFRRLQDETLRQGGW
jgi:metal-responsive CopG/Arc/MetJ family transcriptional regulator